MRGAVMQGAVMSEPPDDSPHDADPQDAHLHDAHPQDSRTRDEHAQPTIDDVARAAGVSKGTVSHVISGRVPVSPATRARVERAIAMLRYRPAETARSLTARKRPSGNEARFAASTPRLTTVGYVSVDYTACLDRLPDREERRLATEITKSIGGPAANVAAIAAGLGPPFSIAASIITAIGLDQDSDWATAELARRHVELIVSRTRRSGRLNRALVLVEADGRRTIVNEPSGLDQVDVQQFLDVTDPLAAPWWLHFEGYHVPEQMAAVRCARAKGFKVSMQATGLPKDWLKLHADEIFQCFDLVVLHQETLSLLPQSVGHGRLDLLNLAGQAKSASRWPELVIITMGAKGAVAITPEGTLVEAPALAVNVVDTTGAGDSFVGGFMAAWLNRQPLAEALLLGCAAGSLQVTRFGAQELRPTARELMHLLPAINLPAQGTELISVSQS